MIIAKQMDVRSNIKKYFDMAYNGEAVVVPRKENKNIVIISETMYNEMMSRKRVTEYAERIASGVMEKAAPKRERPSDVRSFNLGKLEKIAALANGWNGNGAPAIPKELVERVRRLLHALTIQPEIFPTALCSIQFEYDNTRRDHMEIEIGAGEEAEVFIVRYDGTEYFESVSADPDAINELVGDFYG